MKNANRVPRIYIIGLVVLMLKFAGSAHAINRNDVFFELDKLNTNWNDLSVKLWINDFEHEPDPGVLIGDRLIYHVKTNEPAFFVLVLIDAKGNIAVLKPDALEANGILKQAEPLGKETIYLIASDQQLPASVFNLDPSTDYVNHGVDIGEARGLVTRLNAYSASLKVASKRYEYLVDSDTQFSTRGIRREVSERIDEVEIASNANRFNEAETIESGTPVSSSPIVINDINFEYNSDVLTSTGMSQLEVLGSELIDRQEQNELPRVLLTGHTDSSGPAAYNMDLSKRRSMASKRFLVDELGLPAEFIDTHGMGESVPIGTNDTSVGRARNRRVEFEILQ